MREIAGYWSNDEVEFLKENYPKMPSEEIGRAIGKTRAAVHNKAKRLGIRKPKKGGKPQGVKMDKVLSPQQCQKMRHFLGMLSLFYKLAKKEGVEKPDISAFINVYVDTYSKPVRRPGRRKNLSMQANYAERKLAQ